jgi:hypothetical protein
LMAGTGPHKGQNEKKQHIKLTVHGLFFFGGLLFSSSEARFLDSM